ncbi:MAG: 30S ribosomal protein S8 [Trueperaceae bacterium]|jgi:small subunit ribosomal protein S8|nr:MAG: 30S ribosomal protein S8 [Trueperaceae bacterium]
MHSDPIADMLTRIRNAAAIAAPSVDVPTSKFKRSLAQVLVREGYLKSLEDATNADGHPVLRIGLKYGPRRSSIINEIKRVSKPGRRAYAKAKAVPVVRGGLGIAVISTQQGLMVDRDARRANVGGEVVCEVW